MSTRRGRSTRGRVEVDLLAQKAAARHVKPAIIWHSGKLRAKQTAEAFWRHCNPLSTFAAVRGLQPTDPTTWIIDAVTAESKDIMLVGHFPADAKVARALDRREARGRALCVPDERNGGAGSVEGALD